MTDTYYLGSLARVIRSRVEAEARPATVPLSPGDALERVATGGTSDDVSALARMSVEMVAILDPRALQALADYATSLIVDDPIA